MKQYAIGIDLGGTKLALGLSDRKGAVISRKIVPTHAENGAPSVIALMKQEIENWISAYPDQLAGIGIGIAGQVDDTLGIVRFAPNLRWQDVSLRQELQEAFGLPVSLLNDVKAATWGEWLYGAGQGCEDVFCLFLGTGIGAGVVSGGRLLSGASQTCGEIGHFPIQLNGPLCTCGNHGCFEALAGGWAIARQAREAIMSHPEEGKTVLELAGGNLEQVAARHVFEAAQGGDRLSNQLIDAVAASLIAGCTGIINAFNPRRLVLGGGLIKGYPEYVAKIDAGVRQTALKAALKPLEVLPAILMDDAGMIGAAAYVFNQGE